MPAITPAEVYAELLQAVADAKQPGDREAAQLKADQYADANGLTKAGASTKPVPIEHLETQAALVKAAEVAQTPQAAAAAHAALLAHEQTNNLPATTFQAILNSTDAVLISGVSSAEASEFAHKDGYSDDQFRVVPDTVKRDASGMSVAEHINSLLRRIDLLERAGADRAIVMVNAAIAAHPQIFAMLSRIGALEQQAKPVPVVAPVLDPIERARLEDAVRNSPEGSPQRAQAQAALDAFVDAGINRAPNAVPVPTLGTVYDITDAGGAVLSADHATEAEANTYADSLKLVGYKIVPRTVTP